MSKNNETSITPYDDLKKELASDEIIERFHMALGEQRGNAFIVSILNMVSKDRNLQDTEPRSIILSCMKGAALNLPIDPELGFAWVIPYRDRHKGYKVAQMQIGYKGFLQLALRTGQYSALNVGYVYEGQEVKENQVTGEITIEGEKLSDLVTDYVGYLRLTSGYEHYEHWPRARMWAHAKRYAPTWGQGEEPKKSSPWHTHFDEMARGKVLKHLLKNYGLLAISDQDRERMQALEEAISIDDHPDLQDEQSSEVIEGEVITDELDYPEEPPLDPIEPPQSEHVETFIDTDQPSMEEQALEREARDIEDRLRKQMSGANALNEKLNQLNATLEKKRSEREGA